MAELDSSKTYLVWNGTTFPNSSSATFKAPAGSTIDWGDGTIENFEAESTEVNTHTYTDGITEHTIAISGLTSIADSAFDGCSSLTSVTIGNGVKSIGENAFDNCTDLKNIVLFPSVPPTLYTNSIPATVSNIYVQQSSEERYKTATNWIAFAEKIQSNNIYLSLVRFNKKNKEYIDKKLTAPTTPSAESAVTMLADGTVGTKLLNEIGGGGGKLYLHYILKTTGDTPVYFSLWSSSVDKLTTVDKLFEYYQVPQYQDRQIPCSCGGVSTNKIGVLILDYITGTSKTAKITYTDSNGVKTETISGNLTDVVIEV